MENQGLFIGVAHFLKGFLTVTTVTGDFVETKENLSRPSREAESGRRAEGRSWGRREEGVRDGRLGAWGRRPAKHQQPRPLATWPLTPFPVLSFSSTLSVG